LKEKSVRRRTTAESLLCVGKGENTNPVGVLLTVRSQKKKVREKSKGGKRHKQQGNTHTICLDHATDEVVDLVLTVAGIAAHNEAVTLLDETATRGVELEGPEEGVSLLEVRADGVDLVDEVLHADEAVLAEGLLDDLVGGDGDALAGDLGETALVDELADGLEVGIAVGDVGLDKTEHHDGGLVEADKDTVEDLAQTEEAEDLACAG